MRRYRHVLLMILGVGLVLDRFAFDYALEHLAGPYVGNRFGIRLR